MSKKVLTKSEIKLLFSNLEELYSCNSALFLSLQKSKTSTGMFEPNIGILFQQHVRFYPF